MTKLSPVLVLLVLLTYSGLCRPVPSVNEPHYLTKARHYWQPEWCAGDFFLESSNPHRVFYQTIGALTQWLTLEQSAWAGRVIALALLAWGWTRLIAQLSTRHGAAVGTACLFLLLQSLGNFSGEWLVGGVESKVVAWALIFAGWASLLEGRLLPAGTLLGVAISFHPVVGLWCVIATAMALATGVIARQPLFNADSTPASPQWLAALLLMAACSLPGLVPALQSQLGADPEVAALADRYQVGVRLPHHLDPMSFPLASYRYYGLLLLIWLLLRRSIPDRSIPDGHTSIDVDVVNQRADASGADPDQSIRDAGAHSPTSAPPSSPARRLFTRIVLASLVIAGVGILVGAGPRPIDQMPFSRTRVWMLKFYSFRIADLLVPMMLALIIYQRTGDWATRWSNGWRKHAAGLLAAVAFAASLWMPGPDRSSSRMSPTQQADWIASCEWLREQTPADALLYAANEDWAVKWFSHRPEYVNYKDCPQDAPGILEWVRRLRRINRWHKDAFGDGRISAGELHELHEQTGITHLLVSRLGPIDAEPAYRNDSFRVYAAASSAETNDRPDG